MFKPMRLIDADAAKEVISKHENRMAKQHIMILEIEMLPTVESRPCGNWEFVAGMLPHYVCSVCGSRALYSEMASKNIYSPYCPHCGAKMDGAKL